MARFNPRAPGEGRATSQRTRPRARCRCFNPRAPGEGRATRIGLVAGVGALVSIHARPAKGARPLRAALTAAGSMFQSTRARRRARDRSTWASSRPFAMFQSTRARRRARDVQTERLLRLDPPFQSTRARRRARDSYRACGRCRRPRFNPRAPGEGRATGLLGPAHDLLPCFNPRAPGEGRATSRPSACCALILRFNPRAPGEGRATPLNGRERASRACFNPRAPGEGRATAARRWVDQVIQFQSTRARRRARDRRRPLPDFQPDGFNPRAPGEGRATFGGGGRP